MSVVSRASPLSIYRRQIPIRIFSSITIQSNVTNSIIRKLLVNSTQSPFAIRIRSFSSGPASDPNDPNPQYVPLTGRQLELQELGDFPEPDTVGPFGTLKKPTLVYSGLESRIVGCLGGRGSRHRLLWFTVKQGHPHV